jgi:hypothetical protein
MGAQEVAGFAASREHVALFRRVRSVLRQDAGLAVDNHLPARNAPGLEEAGSPQRPTPRRARSHLTAF